MRQPAIRWSCALELRTAKSIATTLKQQSTQRTNAYPPVEDGSRRGHAIVVDFLSHPKSEEAAAAFERAGLQVTRIFATEQKASWHRHGTSASSITI